MSVTGLHGKRVLVTGATGFIGGRVVERLILEQQAEVVALVHQFKNASRLARFPVRMVEGSVTDAAAVAQAAAGCQAIVHCAMSSKGSARENRRVMVEGAHNVCAAARSQGSRLVHLSTFSVYGVTAPGPVDEHAPKKPGKDAYGSRKLKEEQIVQKYQQQGLPATILQPTIVYGPWSPWSMHVLGQLASGVVALPEIGAGLCNAVYVDDVVDAIFLSLTQESAALGPFLVSGALPVTWREFFMAHTDATQQAEIADLESIQAAQTNESSWLRIWIGNHLRPEIRYHLKGLVKEIPCAGDFYRQVKRFRGSHTAKSEVQQSLNPEARPTSRRLSMPSNGHIVLFRSKTRIVSEAAERALGYRPRFSLQEGGALTAAWIKWARLAAR